MGLATNANSGFAARVNNLRNGTGLNGSAVRINGATVKDDNDCDYFDTDTLTGGGGNDWYCYEKGEDSINGMTNAEGQNDLENLQGRGGRVPFPSKTPRRRQARGVSWGPDSPLKKLPAAAALPSRRLAATVREPC